LLGKTHRQVRGVRRTGGKQGQPAKEPGGAVRKRVRGPGASLGPLEDLVAFNLRIAQDASFRAFARETGQHGLKPGRFAALTVIHNNPGISQIALSRAIARDKSTVTPLVQEFVRQGLVARIASKVDRRSFTLTLTAAGEERLRALDRHAATHDRKIDRIVGKEKADLVRILKKIADELG
jgi:DNA-binding MarR family transcriptional regulator